LENYNKGIILIGEAKQLIDSLQKEINSLDTSNMAPSQTGDVNRLISLLEIPSLNFREVMTIVQELRSISAGVKTASNVTNNIEGQVIYEEQDVDTL